MDNYRLVPGDSVGKKIDFLDRKVNPLEVPPEVSIILPAYNAHNTIKRTIASICMQDCVNEIEIIIADDCGDESYDRIAQQFSHMVRIKIVKMLKNGGPGAARQIGFDYSVGKYIMWMDADDTLVSSDTITTLKNVMIERQMDCVYGKFLEQNEDGSIYPHELHMVWMFGKLYRREFLEKYNIRFNTSLSNEDTGFNRLVCACTDKIWYIPKDVYIWQFKANSITRIKQGMYGQDSGYKGYLDNMIWQILESEKRFVNKNYILNEIIQVMCILYHFHVENMQQCPMNTDTSMNWIRGYYDIVYKPHEDEITPAMFDNVFAQTAAGQNIAQKGIIPRLTIYEFMEEVKKPWVEDHDQEIRGSTPAGYIPPITDKEWPVEVTEYVTMVEDTYNVDSDTNFSRYGGMKRKLGLEITDKMVTNIAPTRKGFMLLGDNDMFEAKAVLLATGTVSGKAMPGEEELLGKGISYCATCDGFLYKGKTIAVLCGAERYEHEVAYLAELAEKVYLSATYPGCSIDLPNVEKLASPIKSILGDMRITGIETRDGEIKNVDGCFILRTSVAPTSLISGIEMDGPHIVVNRQMETSLKGVFAAGDCTGRPYQVTKATGEGNVAAHSILEYLSSMEEV